MNSCIEKAKENEKKWFVNYIKTIGLNSLKDGINECLPLLKNEKSDSKLVLSSSGTETIKGILARSGCNISLLDFTVRNQSVKEPIRIKCNLKDELIIPIEQLYDAYCYLETAYNVILQIKNNNKDNYLENSDYINMVNNINTLTNAILGASLALKNPPKTETMFPNSKLSLKLKKIIQQENNGKEFDSFKTGFDVSINESLIELDVYDLQVESESELNLQEKKISNNSSIISTIFGFAVKNEPHGNTNGDTNGTTIGNQYMENKTSVKYGDQMVRILNHYKVGTADPCLISLNAKLDVLLTTSRHIYAELLLFG